MALMHVEVPQAPAQRVMTRGCVRTQLTMALLTLHTQRRSVLVDGYPPPSAAAGMPQRHTG